MLRLVCLMLAAVGWVFLQKKWPVGRTKGTGIWMARVASVALIVGALVAWLMVDQAISAQKVYEVAGERPALFLGNESLPPMNFMKDGKPTGIVVDLAEALAKRMHHPVEIRLMNWTEAQQLVLKGRADALIQINPDPERLKIYDFSEPLLTSEFTIFTSAERHGIASMIDLRGLKVGVEEKGLPILLLKEDPRIIAKIIPDFVQGFGMLATGAVDAMVADRWVGSYVLAENNIRGVKLIDEPIGQSHSAIAVKKGNTNLLVDINAALADIRRDGTYDRIIQFWQPKEVVFKTREQLRQQVWLIGAISVALIVALVSIAVMVREIRRRKRSEATLRDSQGRLRLFIENAPASLAMFDLEMRYLSASHRWVSDYNLGDRDLSGISHYEVFPEIPDYWKEIHRRGIAGEVIRADADRFDRADGSVQWVRWEVRPWYDAAGDVGGIVIFSEDITERKQAEEELRKSKDDLELRVNERTSELRVSNRALMEYAAKLERLNDELQEFAFVASHDLEEPLRKIQTFGLMLARKYQEHLGEQGRDYLIRITRAAKRMSDLLRSLLDYSRIASQPGPFEPVGLAELTSEAVSDLELVINQAGGTVEIGDLPHIDADAVQIRRLLQNLIANSMKYCKDSEKPVVRVYGHSSGTRCTIFVEDNGLGFEEEYADRIFRPFQQLHGRNEYEGTGMGLAICRKIVEHHGGSITAKSMLGKGATFIVQLPVKQRESARERG
jgi:PAS domain S-box-containing protein